MRASEAWTISRSLRPTYRLGTRLSILGEMIYVLEEFSGGELGGSDLL